jgi:hypothetical protein
MTTPTDQDIARAEALARLSVRAGRPVETCPFASDDRVLRARWVLAYARANAGDGALTAARGRFGDGDNFEEYWTAGPGLARWVGSPHPFTTLVALLRKHPKVAAKPGFAERLAATYFKKVKGYWPSERQGVNPVGPG